MAKQINLINAAQTAEQNWYDANFGQGINRSGVVNLLAQSKSDIMQGARQVRDAGVVSGASGAQQAQMVGQMGDAYAKTVNQAGQMADAYDQQVEQMHQANSQNFLNQKINYYNQKDARRAQLIGAAISGVAGVGAQLAGGYFTNRGK